MKRVLPSWITANRANAVDNIESSHLTHQTSIQPIFQAILAEPFRTLTDEPNINGDDQIQNEPTENMNTNDESRASDQNDTATKCDNNQPESTVVSNEQINMDNQAGCSRINDDVDVPVRIKQEPVDDDDDKEEDKSAENAKNAKQIPIAVIAPNNIKAEIKSEETTTNDSLRRPSCQFGIRCYQQNPMHRLNEAHPGDTDYRRPTFPSAPPGTPDCPFGASCYRRNPDHFIRLNHPPSSIYYPNPVVPAQFNPTAANTVINTPRKRKHGGGGGADVGKRQLRKIKSEIKSNKYDDDDDEDEEDPFLDGDDSLDEYNPNEDYSDDDDDYELNDDIGVDC